MQAMTHEEAVRMGAAMLYRDHGMEEQDIPRFEKHCFEDGCGCAQCTATILDDGSNRSPTLPGE